MIAWIQGRDLSVDLQELLVGYSTALVVMQRLESRHHLVNISMSRGRAQTPASVIAGLRRRMNQDLTHPTFRHLALTITSSGGGMGKQYLSICHVGSLSDDCCFLYLTNMKLYLRKMLFVHFLDL